MAIRIRSTMFGALLAITAIGIATAALGQSLPQALPDPVQPEGGEEFFALIEIPAGSYVKYELDPATGRVLVDRFQSMPVAYPANYGFVPASIAADGDPLDAVVYTRTPIVPGALIRVRAIGILRTIDGGEQDDKLITVPTDRIDPTYADIRDIGDLPAIERERLEAFFQVYKNLPEGRKDVELGGFGDATEARQAVSQALGLNRVSP